MRIIRITSNKDGVNTVELFGFVGEDCVKETEAFERSLGDRVGDRNLKPEFHEQEPTLGETEGEEER